MRVSPRVGYNLVLIIRFPGGRDEETEREGKEEEGREGGREGRREGGREGGGGREEEGTRREKEGRKREGREIIKPHTCSYPGDMGQSIR